MQDIKKGIIKSILAGLLIAFAGILYLQCENKIVGSILFSIGLIAVILTESWLFTGKIGYVNGKKTILDVLLMLGINLITAFLVGLIYKGIYGPSLAMNTRLAKSWYRLLFDGIGCGILIYLAVELFKKTKNIIIVSLCVMAFILAGMEHSIADAFYYGSSVLTWEGLWRLLVVILGNATGSLLIRLLQYGLKITTETKSLRG